MFRRDFGYITPPTSPRLTEAEIDEIDRLYDESKDRSLTRFERKWARNEYSWKKYGHPDFDSPRYSEMTETDQSISDDEISSDEIDESYEDEDETASLERYFKDEVAKSISASIEAKIHLAEAAISNK
jgi:hypothetical protein